MTVLGVIAEYNPFHNGHLHHLKASREAIGADFAIAAISGCFVQRGEPAICDKWTRASMALKHGADLVLELPCAIATSSAERFATFGVKLLDSLGVATHMSFGTESGDLEALSRIARDTLAIQDTPEFKKAISEALASGLPYFAACERALMYILRIDQNFIRQPNHILAIEYLKALFKLGSGITPLALKRASGPSFAPASAVRELLLKKDFPAAASLMPDEAFFDLLKAFSLHGPATLDSLSGVFQYLLKTESPEALANIQGISEGLENRLISAASSNYEISKVLKAANTKRYPYSRLQRAALALALKITKQEFLDASNGPHYIRVLGFRKESASLLAEIKRKAKIPVVINLKNSSDLDEPGRSILESDLLRSELYYLACESKRSVPKKLERSKPLVIV
ncbi:MAG: nucleotidyltransferase family protein [Clostridiales bacterium]|jgi:predicted nucleotidyltransferase|nr:nucleotidyltransferase family protein [Clostridiales bacterium]